VNIPTSLVLASLAKKKKSVLMNIGTNESMALPQVAARDA